MSMFSRLSTAGALLMAVSLSTADVAAKETLKVGCEGGFAPFTYIDDRGVLTGFDVDLIRMMGKKMGYDEVEITVYPFDGLIPALMTDNFDLIISGFTISEERAKRVDFSDPYYRCSLTYLVKKEHAQELAKIESLKDKTVCTQIGTTGAMYIEKALPGINLKQFNSPAESYIELQNDGCVATLNDRPVNDYFIVTSGTTGVKSLPEMLTAFFVREASIVSASIVTVEVAAKFVDKVATVLSEL